MNHVGWVFFSNKVLGFDQLLADLTKKTPKLRKTSAALNKDHQNCSAGLKYMYFSPTFIFRSLSVIFAVREKINTENFSKNPVKLVALLLRSGMQRCQATLKADCAFGCAYSLQLCLFLI